MAFTISPHYASTTNHEEAGHRAMDFAKIAQARYPVPLSFIIPCSLYDRYMDESGINARLRAIYAHHPQTVDGYARAYKEVRELFMHVNFSGQLKEELLEAYESLAIPSSHAGATALVEDNQAPAVILIPSLTYRLPEERLEGVQVNVVGSEAFLRAIKESWSSAFLPEHVLGRQHYAIGTFSTGVIVEQQQPVEASAFGSYRAAAASPLCVHSYAGHIDVIGEVAKDEHLLSAEHLQITSRTIRDQQFKLVPGTTGILRQVALGEQGSKQILNDRQVLEVARLTKRAHVVLGQDVTTHCSIRGEHVHLMLVLRENNTGLTRVVEASPEPALQAEDKYIPLAEVTLLESEDDTSSPPVLIDDDASLSDEESPVQGAAVTPYDTAEDEVPAEEGLVEQYDDEVAAPDDEETLFDMVRQEGDVATNNNPGAAFIDEVMTETERVLVETYKRRFGGEPDDYASMVSSLREAGALPMRDDDLRSLESWHERVGAGDSPPDDAIGLAWRVLQQLFR